VKRGVILPTFRDAAHDALDVARRCEEAGVDGVFAYDHLWPMGSPTRPSLAPFPVLAAVAARCPSLWVGPLVARVGMVGNDHLIGQFRALARVAPGRVVAAVGTGDAKSRDELEAYGLDFAGADRRRLDVEIVTRALRDEMPVWIGAGAPATNDLAAGLGATLNLWDADVATVAEHARRSPVTWAGPARPDLADWLDDLARAGSQWAIFAPGVDVVELANWRARG
jgi:alkanesulfonate monooxygenase SsuD/methylene tetrahydromethanopterin reductase-like flavin-dependent oxidoreductase (luciferase family)